MGVFWVALVSGVVFILIAIFNKEIGAKIFFGILATISWCVVGAQTTSLWSSLPNVSDGRSPVLTGHVYTVVGTAETTTKGDPFCSIIVKDDGSRYAACSKTPLPPKFTLADGHIVEVR